MQKNFLSSSSILRKFLVFNLIIFLFLGIFTYLYLDAIKPNLVKNRSNQHVRIINNTIDHIERLDIKFTKKSATKFLLDARFLFQNLDRVQLYDTNANLLADTDTLDLVPNIGIKREGIQETTINNFDESESVNQSLGNDKTFTFNTISYVKL